LFTLIIYKFYKFKNYFGAWVFVIQFISPNKKENYYYMATHYVEVNKYIDGLKSIYYAKILFKPISSIKNQPIYDKIKLFLAEYGISYNINDINKRNSDVSENSPVVMYNKINNIIDSHFNTMYFYYDAYIQNNIDKTN